MNEVTVSAKTLDDAITEALIQLGATSDMVEYEVIEKGSAGFFGIGSKQAVVKAWRKKVEEPVVEEPKAEPKKEASKKEFAKKETEKKEFVKKEFVKKEHGKKEHAKKEYVKKEVPVKKSHEEKPKTEEPKKEEALEREPQVLGKVEDSTIKACEVFLQDVLKAMDMEVKITSSIDNEGALNINMEGENMGILIGKRGQTLDSLQYLTNRIANKNQEEYVRVKLDTENYRQRREETLENLAKNIAYKVKRTKKSVSLEPMNPYERRVIHSALQGDKYVSTHSEGEEPYRRVVVTLAKRY